MGKLRKNQKGSYWDGDEDEDDDGQVKGKAQNLSVDEEEHDGGEEIAQEDDEGQQGVVNNKKKKKNNSTGAKAQKNQTNKAGKAQQQNLSRPKVQEEEEEEEEEEFEEEEEVDFAWSKDNSRTWPADYIPPLSSTLEKERYRILKKFGDLPHHSQQDLDFGEGSDDGLEDDGDGEQARGGKGSSQKQKDNKNQKKNEISKAKKAAQKAAVRETSSKGSKSQVKNFGLYLFFLFLMVGGFIVEEVPFVAEFLVKALETPAGKIAAVGFVGTVLYAVKPSSRSLVIMGLLTGYSVWCYTLPLAFPYDSKQYEGFKVHNYAKRSDAVSQIDVDGTYAYTGIQQYRPLYKDSSSGQHLYYDLESCAWFVGASFNIGEALVRSAKTCEWYTPDVFNDGHWFVVKDDTWVPTSEIKVVPYGLIKVMKFMPPTLVLLAHGVFWAGFLAFVYYSRSPSTDSDEDDDDEE